MLDGSGWMARPRGTPRGTSRISPESTTFLVSVEQSPRMSAHASGLSRLNLSVLADSSGTGGFTVFVGGKIEKFRIWRASSLKEQKK